MNDKIYSSRFLSSVACWFSRLKNPSFPASVKERSSYSVFDYNKVGAPLPKYYEEICTDNNSFGIGHCLREYAGYSKGRVNGWIEHGYFWADVVSSLATKSFTKTIMTFGSHRVRVNQDLLPQKRVIAIGPYIHYAPDYLSPQEFNTLKEEVGRTLLVFPVHSGTGMNTDYDVEELFKYIDSISNGFDTIIFSLFWSDITEEYVNRLKEHKKVRIACSGHRYDWNFLSRQKTLIKLSDATMSNGLGTNLVYCTYLGKPHWLVNQEVSRSAQNSSGIAHLNYIKNNANNSSIKEEFLEQFSQYSESLTETQYNLCRDTFGFNSVLEPPAMFDLLNSLK